jgi:hypothetical protein
MRLEYKLTKDDEANIISGFMAITLWELIFCSVAGNLGFRDVGIFIAHLGLWSWFVMVCSIVYIFYHDSNQETTPSDAGGVK